MTDQAAAEASLDLIVFDFDGTLCDSADVKTEAFYDLYLDDHGSAFATAVVGYHLANVGVSRYDKIRFIESEMLDNDVDDASVDQVAERYSSLVEQAVVDAPLFDGVSEFLAAPPAGVRFALASATPTKELRRIVQRKGLGEFFAAIEGSPQSKTRILAAYVDRFADSPQSTLMVGDQPSDTDAARTVGTKAIAIAPPEPWTAPFHRADTFKEAANWIRTALL